MTLRATMATPPRARGVYSEKRCSFQGSASLL